VLPKEELTPRPKDANEWSDGKALMATGSPFPPVDTPGTDKKYIIAECNNVSNGQ
jgi:malate dehydrogenase (oxaloacetate-decarboxylating)